MKNLLFLVMILFLGAGFSLNSFAQEQSKDDKKEIKTEQKSDETAKVEDGKPFNIVCPVSGEDVDQEVTYTYNGKTYALCCKNCLKKFKKDPEKYISRLSEDGKSLIKKKSE